MLRCHGSKTGQDGAGGGGWDWALSVSKCIMILSHVIRMQCQMRLMRFCGPLLHYTVDLTIDHPISSDGPDLCVSG